MALVLLSYFSTMVTVFATLMFLLTNVFGSISVHQHRAEPHRMSAVARAIISQRVAAAEIRRAEVAQAEVAQAEVAQAEVVHAEFAHAELTRPNVAASIPAAPQKASAEIGNDRITQAALKQVPKAKLVRIAHNEKRKEHLAERHRDQEDSTLAIGYASEPREPLEAARIFNTIGAIRTTR